MRHAVWLSICLFSGLLYAQDPAQPQPQQPKPAEAEAPDSLGLSVDFVPYIRRVYPDLDPAGEHDVFKLKFYDDESKRHAYSVAMDKLLRLYIADLDLGSTLAKLFDAHSRGRNGDQPTFKLLHGIVLIHYPPGRGNLVEAEKLLREAVARAPEYAFAWYQLAHLEYAKVAGGITESAAEARRVVSKVIELAPDYVPGHLLLADLILTVQGPRGSDAAIAVLEPLLERPLTSDEFEYALLSLRRAMTAERFRQRLEALLAREGLPKDHRARGLAVGADLFLNGNDLDLALEWMEQVPPLIDAAGAPARLARAEWTVASIWGMKAQALRQKNPTLPGEDRDRFEQFRDAAIKGYRRAVEIETRHMPIEFRGRYALTYVAFMRGSRMLEEALTWIEKYLAETDLPSVVRSRLELEMIQIRNAIDPNEEDQVKVLVDLVKREAVPELLNALNTARENIRRGVRFRSVAAREFFVEQLKHHDRQVVAACAELAADTVLAQTDGPVAEVAAAIAARFEQESECRTNEQEALQTPLCRALRELGNRTAQARAVRHLSKLVQDGGRNVERPLQRVVQVFHFRDYVADLKDAPAMLNNRDQSESRPVVAWLNKLADAIDAAARN